MDPVLHLALRASLILLLATAAFHKLSDLPRFRSSLEDYDLLPAALVPAMALSFASLEAALAFLLASGVAVAEAGVMVSLLMLLYAAAIAINLRRGRVDLDCGCMGPAARVPLGRGLVARNLVVALAAGLLVLTPSLRALTLLDLVSVLAATASMAACWLATERMLALAPRVEALRARGRATS